MSGQTALVTGASSGIGAAYARLLARTGYDVVLVARRSGRLRDLASALETQHKVSAEVLQADLSDPQGIEAVEAAIRRRIPALLVHAAGFSTLTDFIAGNLGRHLTMVNVHDVAALRLVHAALPGMVQRRDGAIILVSSIAAFLPYGSPVTVTYSATKAFLNAFGRALWTELRGSGVRIQVLCPGFTRTEFHSGADFVGLDLSMIPGFLWTSADDVARASYRALQTGRVVVIPDLRTRVFVSLTQSRLAGVLMRRLTERMLARMIKPALSNTRPDRADPVPHEPGPLAGVRS